MLAVYSFAREVFFINSAADIDHASGRDTVVVNSNLEFAFLQQLVLENAQLDCLMHTITAQTPPLDVIFNATVRNCVFKVENGISADFNSSALINTIIISNGASVIFKRTHASVLSGVRSSTTNSFAVNVTNTTIVGCAFYHDYSSIASVSALFNRTNQSLVQNTFFNLSVSTKNQRYVAGMAIVSDSVSLIRVRAVLNVTASMNSSGKTVAGLIANVSGKTRIDDMDVLSDMVVSYAYTTLSGVLGYVSADDVSVFNASLAARINVGMFEPNAYNQSDNNIGSFCGQAVSGTIILRAVSAFVDIVRDCSDTSKETVVTGLTGYATNAALQLANCHVFGTVALYNYIGTSSHVAGIAAYLKRSSTLDSCSFSGNVVCAVENGTYAYVGGVGVRFIDASMHNCFSSANVSVVVNKLQTSYVAGLIASLSGVTISSSVVNGSIAVDSTYFTASTYIGGFSVLATFSTVIRDSSCVTGIEFSQAPGKLLGKGIALFSTGLQGNATNCSVRGGILISAEKIGSNDCYVAGIVASARDVAFLADFTVTGSIEASESFTVAAAFDSLGFKAEISNVLVAIAFPGRAGVNAFYDSNKATINNVFVDCGMAGNNISQEYCRSDLKSQTAADALGAGFGWKQEYNGAYPYLLSLPAWDGVKYVLPASGPFSEEFYYVDGLGYPFRRTDYQICRGACYGTYESPLVRNCTNTTNNNTTNTTNNNSYCIQPELAETDFQTASCIQENAHCNSGASTCTSESELKLNQTDSTYICELGCPGCVNGHCQNNTCVCNLYHSEDDCSTYQCDNDSPACFGNPTMECAADGSGCVPTDACAALGCVHGSCVVSSSNKTRCRCDNMWTGSRCDRCNAYGPECSVSQSECNRLCGAHGHCGTPLTTVCTCSLGFGGANCGGCAAGHTAAVGDRCVCGDRGGPCQLRQTCVDGVCVADCLLADSYCAECEVADQSVCARCVKQHTIQNGICQFHLSAAVSTSFAVVLGVAAAIAAALGAALLFRLLSAKRGGNKQKPVGDGVKLDAVQSGPKQVGKAEKPLLEQIPAMQDVNIDIGIDSARDGR